MIYSQKIEKGSRVQKILDYITKPILSGFIVILPIGLLWWVWDIISNTIRPLTDFILEYVEIPSAVAPFIAFVLLLFILLLVGKFVETAVGRYVHGGLEKWLLHRIPFYETLRQILSLWKEKRIFQAFALVQINENSDELAPCFITDENPISGTCTVLHLTSPNPTSGFPRIVSKDRVHKINGLTTAEKWHIIISCGAGTSTPIVDKQIKTILEHIKKSA